MNALSNAAGSPVPRCYGLFWAPTVNSIYFYRLFGYYVDWHWYFLLLSSSTLPLSITMYDVILTLSTLLTITPLAVDACRPEPTSLHGTGNQRRSRLQGWQQRSYPSIAWPRQWSDSNSNDSGIRKHGMSLLSVPTSYLSIYWYFEISGHPQDRWWADCTDRRCPLAARRPSGNSWWSLPEYISAPLRPARFGNAPWHQFQLRWLRCHPGQAVIGKFLPWWKSHRMLFPHELSERHPKHLLFPHSNFHSVYERLHLYWHEDDLGPIFHHVCWPGLVLERHLEIICKSLMWWMAELTKLREFVVFFLILSYLCSSTRSIKSVLVRLSTSNPLPATLWRSHWMSATPWVD